MSVTLTERLEALEQGTDFTDPQTYSKLMGYDEAPAEAAPATEGETQAAAAPTAPAAQESSASPAAAEPVETEAAGIATKDGKHVIPMAVLTDTRNALARANAQAQELAKANQRLQQELEAKAAPAPAPAEPALSDEDLAEIEADFPAVGKLAKAYKSLQAEVEQVKAEAAQPRQQVQVVPQVDVQPLIDQRPLLSQWQAKGGIAWAEAVKLDNDLKGSAEWATKPQAERFAEVERRIAEDLGIPVPAATQATPAPAQRPAPAAAPVATTVTPTLTDFNGSAATVGDPMASLTPGQMVDKAMTMDMESLRKMAGLSY